MGLFYALSWGFFGGRGGKEGCEGFISVFLFPVGLIAEVVKKQFNSKTCIQKLSECGPGQPALSV